MTAHLTIHTEHVQGLASGVSRPVKGLQSWDGCIDGLDGAVAYAIWDTDGALLRAEDDREGKFLITGGSMDGGPVSIQGSGPAPFGDPAA